MRSVEEVLKNHFGSAKIMDESTAAAAAAASSKVEGKSDATAATTVKGAYKSARENRAATLAAAEALASFPTSAASISTPGDGSDGRDQPPPLFSPASSTSAPAWMMKGGISGTKQTIASAAKKKVAKVKYVKDPRAPKRFKSAFIFFTMHRHKTIRKEIEEKEGGPGSGERVSGVSRI